MKLSISVEDIIALVVKEVIKELDRRGVQIDGKINEILNYETNPKKIRIDMSEYKTPLLTEAHILKLDSKITEIEIPIKTIITPSARDLIKKRKIIITEK